MSRRSVRKVRHRLDAPKVFSFKQRVQMGMITGKINRKEITLQDIEKDPKLVWMLDAWKEIQQAVEPMVALPAEVPAQFNEPEPPTE